MHENLKRTLYPTKIALLRWHIDKEDQMPYQGIEMDDVSNQQVQNIMNNTTFNNETTREEITKAYVPNKDGRTDARACEWYVYDTCVKVQHRLSIPLNWLV